MLTKPFEDIYHMVYHVVTKEPPVMAQTHENMNGQTCSFEEWVLGPCSCMLLWGTMKLLTIWYLSTINMAVNIFPETDLVRTYYQISVTFQDAKNTIDSTSLVYLCSCASGPAVFPKHSRDLPDFAGTATIQLSVSRLLQGLRFFSGCHTPMKTKGCDWSGTAGKV